MQTFSYSTICIEFGAENWGEDGGEYGGAGGGEGEGAGGGVFKTYN